MNPIIIIFILATVFAVSMFVSAIVRSNKFKKQLKNMEKAFTDECQNHENTRNQIDALKSGNDGLKKVADEMGAKLEEAQKANEEFKSKETEDAKREEDNAKAFEDVQALLKEAEETNEVLLKCISGEITMLEATAQLGEIRKTSVVKEEEPVEDSMEARG